MDELVSIIVPVYRAADYICRTIECVCAQTFTNWELILIDDCSDDETVETIESHMSGLGRYKRMDEMPDETFWICEGAGSIRLYRKRHNEGAAMARNTGLDLARGRYIAFLDADDVWLPTRLEKGLSHMKSTGAGFVFSAYEFGDENASGTGNIVHVPAKLDYKKALSRTVIFTTTTLFDTQIIPVRLLQMPPVPSEDTATWWQILRSGYTAYGIDEVLAIYRRPARSLSSNKIEAVKRIWNLYRNVEGLSLAASLAAFIGWAVRATLRRI